MVADTLCAASQKDYDYVSRWDGPRAAAATAKCDGEMRAMPIVCFRSRGRGTQRPILLLAAACAGFSLVETLLVLGIIALCTTFGFIYAHKLIYTHHVKQNMQQIQLAFAYARSSAIASHNKVTICPSQNGKSCSSDWRHGVLVLNSKQAARFFALQPAGNAHVFLHQSGFSSQIVEIQANGTCHHNGHFSFLPANRSELPTFNLYFNRIVRLYWESIH